MARALTPGLAVRSTRYDGSHRSPSGAAREVPGGFGGPVHGSTGPGPVSPARRSNTGLLVGLIAGCVVLAILVVVLVVVLGGPVSRTKVSTPPQAGGFALSASTEPSITRISTRARAATRSTGARISTLVSGLYRDPAAPPSMPVTGGVVFVGGTGDLGDPGTFIQHLRSAPGVLTAADDKVVDVDAGGDGRAACFTVGDGPTDTCVWATAHSFGTITPTELLRVDHAAAVMRRMRPDVERR